LSTSAEADQPLSGQVCVLTGASSGIGLTASIELARLGATMILVARDPDRGSAALAQVGQAATGAPPQLELADLASQQQVRDLAGRLAERPVIDVLINNAGLVVGDRTITADGIEETFAVNHLAPFLLTNLLRPTLAASPAARVVTVSLAAHRAARLNLEHAATMPHYLAMLAYANSKLANVLFTAELARRLTGPVTANCLHPGVIGSRFGQSGAPWLRLGMTLAQPFLTSPQAGARTTIFLASSQQVAGQTGGYYFNCRLRRPSAAARNPELARQLWELSAKLTDLPADL
jgi:retinol dehydrogenase 12